MWRSKYEHDEACLHSIGMSRGIAARYLWIYRSCEQLYNEDALSGWPALLTSSLYSQTSGCQWQSSQKSCFDIDHKDRLHSSIQTRDLG